MKSTMKRPVLLVLLAACGSSPPRAVETVQGHELEALWSGECDLFPRQEGTPEQTLPVALPWGSVLYARDGRVVCAEDTTGRALWSVEADTGEIIQAGACREEVAILESGGRLRTFSLDGRLLARIGSTARGLHLVTAADRLYLFDSLGVDAYDPVSLRHLWSWRALTEFECRRIRVDGCDVAVEAVGRPGLHVETFLLDFDSGGPRSRSLGRCLGWHAGRVHLVRGEELWVRDGRTGTLVEVRRLDRFDGRGAVLHEGKAIYSSRNRYFTGGRFRVGRGGATETPQSVDEVRELEREGEWRRPLDGEIRLLGDVVFDAGDRRLTAYRAGDGAMLWEASVPSGIRGFGLGPRALFVVSGDGRITALRHRRT